MQRSSLRVKSSLGSLNAITLTRQEYEAAKHHAANYVIATVEDLGGDDPIVQLRAQPGNKRASTRNSLHHLHHSEICMGTGCSTFL